MENVNFIEKLAAQFNQNATVKSVYGQPVVAGEKTIIPVARVAYGLGGGYGHGKNKMEHLHEFSEGNNEEVKEEGAGGGGGMFAKPAGVFEITKSGTRFIPASSTKILVTGLVIGLILRGLLFRRKRK